MDCVVFGRERGGFFFGIAEGHDGTTGVGQDAIDGAVVGEVVNDGARGSAEYDEACVEIDGCGEDLDGGMAVSDAGFNLSTTEFFCSSFSGEDLQFA